MKKRYLIIGLVFVTIAGWYVEAKSSNNGSKKGWRQTGHTMRSLYLDFDPAVALGSMHKQIGLTDEQIRELRSIEAHQHDELVKDRSVAQDAREELDRAMSQEPPEENTIRKSAERAILADAAAARARLQFWLEARQRLGKEPVTKIRQAMAKHLHDNAVDEPQNTTDIVPPQKPQLPAKD